MKFDGGKVRMALVPFDAVEQVAAVLTFGAYKYEPNRSCFGTPNWANVPNGMERYADAALRHYFAWIQGEDIDLESGLHHLSHAATNVMFLLSMLARDGRLPPIPWERWKEIKDKYAAMRAAGERRGS